MLSNTFQKLTLFFREKYISSLKCFVIKFDPDEIKKETYIALPVEWKNKLEDWIKIYAEKKNEWAMEKQNWENEVKETGDKNESLSVKSDIEKLVEKSYNQIAHEPAKRQVAIHEAAIKQLGAKTNIYLVKFEKPFTTKKAKRALLKIGFEPANLLESILLYQEYKDILRPYLLLMTLDACADDNTKVGIVSKLKEGIFTLCMYTDDESIKFGHIGEVENMEFNGSDFSENVYLVAKPL
jgi:hypothetical protein